MDIYIDKTSTNRVCEIEEGILPESIIKIENQIKKVKKTLNRKEDGSNNKEKEEQTLLAKEEKLGRSIQSFIGWLSNQIVFACNEELTLYIVHNKKENKGTCVDECQRKFISVMKRKCREYDIELYIEDINEMPDMELLSLDDISELDDFEMPLKQMNITRYTKDVWFETNPDSTEEEFEQIASPYNPYDFISNMLENTQDVNFDDIAIIRLITLGQEYLDWIKKHGLKNTEESRIKYINELSLQDADRVMKKYRYDRVLTLSCFFVSLASVNYSVLPRKTMFQLKKEDKERITEILEEVYGEGNVYVPGCIVKPDVYTMQKDRFAEMAIDYFENGKEPNIDRWKEQKFLPGTNMSAVVVPVFLWDMIDTCMISVEQYAYESDQTMYYNNELSDEIIQSQQECTEIGMIIRSCFSNRYEPIIYEALVEMEFVPEMYEYIGEIMSESSIHLI